MRILQQEVSLYYMDKKSYPKKISINPDLLLQYRKKGYISLSPLNSKLVILDIEIEVNDKIETFKLI